MLLRVIFISQDNKGNLVGHGGDDQSFYSSIGVHGAG